MSEQKKTPEGHCEDFVRRYFRFFNEVYSSDREMLQYCLKFQQIYQPLKRAFDEFYSLSEFYRAMKLMKTDFIKLIMITSIIEKLSSKKDFVEFGDWVSKRRKRNMIGSESIEKVWQEYNKDFGCSGKFRRFFQNPDYLSKTEQMALLKSVCYLVEDDNNSKSLVPLFCYNKNVCGPRNYGCRYDSENCPAYKEERILKKGIKEFADFLYNLRNRFVHDAHMFGLSREVLGTTSDFFTYVPYTFRHIRRPSYNGFVVMRLTGKKLEEILNRNFEKLLDGYIDTRV